MTTLTIDIKGRDGFSRVAQAVEQGALRLRDSLAGISSGEDLGKGADPLLRMADALDRAGTAAGRFSGGADSLKGVSRRFTALSSGLTKLDKVADTLQKRSSFFSRLADDLGKIGDAADKIGRATKGLRSLAKGAEAAARETRKAKEEAEALGEAGAQKGTQRLTGSLGRLEKVADSLNQKFGTVGKGGKGMAADLDRIGKKIEATTDGFDKLRNATDAVGDTLQALLGRRGRKIADAIEDNIEDPAERAEVALRELEKAAKQTPNALDRANAGFGRLKGEVELLVAKAGPVGGLIAGGFIAGGAAALAFAVKLSGAVVSAFEDVAAAAISNSKTLERGADNASNAWDNLRATIGTALLGGIQQGRATLDGFARIFDRLSDKIEENSDTIRSSFITAVKAADITLDLFKPTILGTALAFGLLADAVVAPSRAVNVFVAALENGEDVLVALKKAASDVALDGFTANILKAVNGAFGLKKDLVGAVTESGDAADQTKRSFAAWADEYERLEDIASKSRLPDLAGADAAQIESLARQDVLAAQERRRKIGAIEQELAQDKLRNQAETNKALQERERLFREQSALEERSQVLSGFARQARAEEKFLDQQKKGREAAAKRLSELRQQAREDAQRQVQVEERQEQQSASQLQSRVQSLRNLERQQSALADQTQRLAQENKGFMGVLQEDINTQRELARVYGEAALRLEKQYAQQKAVEEQQKRQKQEDQQRAQSLRQVTQELRAQGQAQQQLLALVERGDLGGLERRRVELERQVALEKQVRDELALRLAMEASISGTGSKAFEALNAQLDASAQKVTRLTSALESTRQAVEGVNWGDAFARGFEEATSQAGQSVAEFGKNTASALSNTFTTVFAGIGEGFTAALAGGADGADVARKVAGQVASIWGDLFLARAAAEFWINPAAGVGLALAGGGLKALAARWGGAGGGSSASSASRGSRSVSAAASRTRETVAPASTDAGQRPLNLHLDDFYSVRGYLKESRHDDNRRAR